MKTKLQSDGTSCPAALLRLGVPSQRLTTLHTGPVLCAWYNGNCNDGFSYLKNEENFVTF